MKFTQIQPSTHRPSTTLYTLAPTDLKSLPFSLTLVHLTAALTSQYRCGTTIIKEGRPAFSIIIILTGYVCAKKLVTGPQMQHRLLSATAKPSMVSLKASGGGSKNKEGVQQSQKHVLQVRSGRALMFGLGAIASSPSTDI